MADVTHYVRFERNGSTSFGELEGETIHVISGDLFGAR